MKTDFGIFFLGCIIVLAILIFLCLVRAIRGPRIADRIMAANMIGTLTIVIILLLAVYLNETYILDVALVYAVISFLGVVVITKIYIGLYRENKIKASYEHERAAARKRKHKKKRRKNRGIRDEHQSGSLYSRRRFDPAGRGGDGHRGHRDL